MGREPVGGARVAEGAEREVGRPLRVRLEVHSAGEGLVGGKGVQGSRLSPPWGGARAARRRSGWGREARRAKRGAQRPARAGEGGRFLGGGRRSQVAEVGRRQAKARGTIPGLPGHRGDRSDVLGGPSPVTAPVSRNVTGPGSGDRRPSFLPLRAMRPPRLHLRRVRPRAGLLPGRLRLSPSARVDESCGSQVPGLAQGSAQARSPTTKMCGQDFCKKSDASGMFHRGSKRHSAPVGGARSRAGRRGGSRWHGGRRRCGSGARR